MNLAKHFTETFAPVGSRTDFSMANVLAATGKITATDFDIYRFIDQDINPHAPPTLNIFGTVSYLAAVRDVTFLTKHASDRTKYKHNKWWLEFNLLGSNKVTKIGVDTLALPLQSSSQGPNFAHPQDQKVLQNFTTMMQEVLTPFLRVDLAPLLPSSIKFIAYNGPLPEIRDIHKFSKTIGTMCLYYDQDSYQYYNHKILIAWTFSKVDAPSITVILADDEKLPADPQSLAYQTLVQHLSSVIQQIIVDKIFVGPSRDEPPLSKDDLFSRIADHRRGKAIFSWVIRRIIFAGQDSADLDVEPAPALLDQQAALLYLETIRQITQSAPRADIDEMIEFVQAYLQDDFDHAPRLQGARDYVHHPKPYYITKELEVLKDQLQEFINERIYRLSTKNSKVDASKLSAITEDIKKIRAKILGEEDLKGDLQNFLQEFCQTPTFTELSPDAQEFIQAYLQNSYRINAHNNLLYNLFKKYNLYRSWQRLNFLPAAITIKDDQITFPVQWENNKALFKITLPWGDEPRDINQTIKEKLLPFAARLNNKKHNLSEILKDDIEIILRYPDSQELIKVDDAFLLANNSETIVLTDMKQGQGKYSLLAGVSPDKQRLYIIIPRNKSSEIKIGDYPIKGYWNFPGTDIILPKVVQDLLTRQDPVEQDALAK